MSVIVFVDGAAVVVTLLAAMEMRRDHSWRFALTGSTIMLAVFSAMAWTMTAETG